MINNFVSFLKEMNINKFEESYKLYGGGNKKNPPFDVGDIIKQIYRVDDNDNLVRDGKAQFEFIGMKNNDLMLLKSLNKEAAYGDDIINPKILKISIKKGFRPKIGDIKQLHYKYADRYEVISKK